MNPHYQQRLAHSIAVCAAADGPWSALAKALRSSGLATHDLCGAAQAPLDVDLVLLDLNAPFAKQAPLAATVTSLARLGKCLVVALVSRGDEAAISKAFEAGAVDFIDCEDDLATALQRVRYLLRAFERRARTREVARNERDELTGLPTRAHFLRSLDTSIARSRDTLANVGVLCVELDRMREIAGLVSQSDTDELVCAVAQRLRDAVRTRDIVARRGVSVGEDHIARLAGEEFTLLLEGLVHTEDAAKVARRIIDLIAQPFTVAGREVFLASSVGIACFPAEGNCADVLVKNAETAAFCSKQRETNGLQFFTPAMNARALERMSLKTHLHHAIERDELVLHYQPRIDIAGGRTLGMEALVRWRHPELGLVSPAKFIPIAEATGLIVPLGEWVLREACEQNRRWQERGFAPIKVSVNLSPVQFRQPDLFETVVRALGHSGLDARWLELELTETSLMSNFESVATTLRRFKELGISLSIDDFGTGYSSLSYLRRFPIDALKIDQSFLREVATNKDDASIVTAIVLMGKCLGLTVVAEGIETPGQLAFMRVMKCDEAQGYLISKPLPALEIEHFLVDERRAAA